MTRVFSFRDVLALTAATRSQLIYLTDREVIVADVVQTAGTGHPRAFSFRNVVQVRIAVLLKQRGLSLEAIKFVVKNLPLGREQSRWDEVAWIQADRKATDMVWRGSARELADELTHPVLLYGHAGIVLRIRDIAAALQRAVTKG